MTAPSWSTQSGFDVRMAWGPTGVDALAGEVAALVLIDLLRFTTALDVAVAAGAVVFPTPWPPDRTSVVPDAEVADGSGPRGLSLAPASLSALAPGDRVVLPSVNGSHCSVLAARHGTTVVGGSLRNAAAVSRWLGDRFGGHPIGVVACGERWPDGSLRPAVEDLIGAGAVVAALVEAHSSRCSSPEARAADAAYRAAAPDLLDAISASASGRELAARGLGDALPWAAALNVSSCVPVLGPAGAYVAG